MFKKIFLILILTLTILFQPAVSLAGKWTLINGATASSTVTSSEYCLRSSGSKTLTFTTSGTVDMSITIKEDSEEATTKTITLTSATTKKYETNHRMDSLKLDYTITSGTLTVNLRCD